MFAECSYHLLDSIVPPSADENLSNQESLLRLENICARAIVRKRMNCQILSEIPTHLHKNLWKVYLTDKYYLNYGNINNMYPFRLDELPELLYHWPQEEFILKEVMPKFLLRLNSFNPKKYAKSFAEPFHGPLHQFKTYLLQFHENVVNTIAHTFTMSSNDSFPEQHTEFSKLRKINISGFGYIFGKNLLPGGKNEMDDFTEMEKINEPFLKNSAGKLEVILDGYFNGTYPPYSNTYNSVVLKFGHVSLYGSYQIKDATQLIERLVNNGTISINLTSHVEDSEIIENVFKTNESQANILAVGLGCASSVNFVQYLKNLVHLDLSEILLHGCLGGLLHMHRGLLFLNLNDCGLENIDLAQLTGSCHQSTLQELNLSCNSFDYDKNSNSNLISLCQNLTNVLILELDNCGLESWQGHSNEIALLFSSFKNMPKLVILNLHDNRFSIDTFTDHIMVLHESQSLRYLELYLPQQFNEGHIYNRDDMIFYIRINKKMNKMRSQLLYVDFCQC